MARYSLPGSAIVVSATPIEGLSDAPDAVSIEWTGADSAILTIRLLKSSRSNAFLTAQALLGAVTPLMLPSIIIPGGLDCMIWAANTIFAKGRGRIVEGTGGTIAWWRGNTSMMPQTFTMGPEVGTTEWTLMLAGIKVTNFGG